MCALWGKTVAANNYENPMLSALTRPKITKGFGVRGMGSGNFTNAAARGLGLENYTKAALRGMGLENYTKAALRGMGAGKRRTSKRGGWSLAKIKNILKEIPGLSAIGATGKKILAKILPGVIEKSVTLVADVMDGALDGKYPSDETITKNFRDLLTDAGHDAMSSIREDVPTWFRQPTVKPPTTVPKKPLPTPPKKPLPTPPKKKETLEDLFLNDADTAMYDTGEEEKPVLVKSGWGKKGCGKKSPKFGSYAAFEKYLKTLKP